VNRPDLELVSQRRWENIRSAGWCERDYSRLGNKVGRGTIRSRWPGPPSSGGKTGIQVKVRRVVAAALCRSKCRSRRERQAVFPCPEGVRTLRDLHAGAIPRNIFTRVDPTKGPKVFERRAACATRRGKLYSRQRAATSGIGTHGPSAWRRRFGERVVRQAGLNGRRVRRLANGLGAPASGSNYRRRRFPWLC